MTAFNQRLAQVAMTYATRPLFRWCGAMFVLLVIVILSQETWRSNELTRVAFVMAQLGIVYSALAGMQSRVQFVTPAARLVPGYRGPHLVALALLGALSLFVTPLLVGPPLGIDAVGFAALSVVIASLFLWASHEPRLLLFSMGGFFSLFLPQVSRFWLDPALGVQPQRVILLIAGWWGFAAWLVRLVTLNEERKDYVIPPISAQFRGGRASRSERGEQRKLAARALKKGGLTARLSDWRLDRALRADRPRPSALSRLGFTNLPSLFGGLFLGLIMGIAFFAISTTLRPATSGNGKLNNVPDLGLLLQYLVFTAIMPPSFSQGKLVAKLPLVEPELLRPTTRRDYFRRLTDTVILDTLGALGAMLLVGLLLFGWPAPEELPPEVKAAAGSVGHLAAVAGATLLAGEVLLSAFAVWITSYRLGLLGMLLGVVPIMALVIPVALWVSFLETLGYTTGWGLVLVYGLSAWLMRGAAIRRWVGSEVA